MKKALFILLAILLCGCAAREGQDAPINTEETQAPTTTAVHEHTVVIDSAVSPTCVKQGWTEGSHCAECGKVLEARTPVAKTAHTPAVTPPVAPTCTTEGTCEGTSCAVCGYVIVPPVTVAKAVHEPYLGKCKLCGTTDIDYSDIRLYASGLGYAFFETAEHGEGMRKLYDEMMEKMSRFHTSADEDALHYTKSELVGEVYRVAVFDFANYGLTLEEAQTVYTVFRMDNPIFYWISYWLYWTDRSIAITTTEEYAKGEVRAALNEQLYAGIKEYAEAAEGETSAYETALAYYEEIAKHAEYAYNDQDKPEDALWAHSIIGTFTHGKFVCEGYGKLFQILLNLSGIENSYISGDAGGNHFWNTAKMDDGNWYWFDITWGDGSTLSYKYFCATDSELTTHVPTDPNTLGMYFNGPIPDCADKPFSDGEIFEIGERVIIDGCEYVRTSRDTVRITPNGSPVPQAVSYLGRTYTVTK